MVKSELKIDTGMGIKIMIVGIKAPKLKIVMAEVKVVDIIRE